MLGHFKLCTVLAGGFIIFRDELNMQQAAGIFLTLIGIFAYTHYKLKVRCGIKEQPRPSPRHETDGPFVLPRSSPSTMRPLSFVSSGDKLDWQHAAHIPSAAIADARGKKIVGGSHSVTGAVLSAPCTGCSSRASEASHATGARLQTNRCDRCSNSPFSFSLYRRLSPLLPQLTCPRA